MKKILIIKIPDEIHLKFKLSCVKKKISMNDRLLKMLEKEIEKEEKKNV